MAEILCPSCGHTIDLDEANYDSIARQVRDKEFDKALEARMRDERSKSQLSEEKLRAELDREHSVEIEELKRKLSVLESSLHSKETEQKLAVAEAVSEEHSKVRDLELQLGSLREGYESRLRDKDEMLSYYKDLKARQSTKMIGENLEQHCEIEFNKIRALGFNTSRVYFEKDNDASSGSKGDYIYREVDENGIELLSIMFEMKNEMESTKRKHKNSDFFEELDRDRREKRCEYAILVTLLEVDNEVYNQGIVDVSYKFDKMYVVRPQFFIPIITILRNAAYHSADYRRELAVLRSQNADIVRFEEKLFDFKERFGRNYRIASEKFNSAIADIDKAIAALERTKKELLSSENNLRLANNKAEELTIQKLTADSPSLMSGEFS